jgi:hypothetical protein
VCCAAAAPDGAAADAAALTLATCNTVIKRDTKHESLVV